MVFILTMANSKAPFKLFRGMGFGIVQQGLPTCLGSAMEVPGFRVELAKQHDAERNMLFKLWGGIGDQICAEPTLRWATEGGGLKGCNITLATNFPELFGHLKFDDVYDTKIESPIEDDFNIFETIAENGTLAWQFMSHMIVNCVDYPSLCSLRFTLYTKDKNVILQPSIPEEGGEILRIGKDSRQFVLVHAGRHWLTKTFPKAWWDAVLSSIIREGKTPVLIGRDDGPDKDPGTVQVNTTGCINLVNKTSLMESVWLAQNLPVVFCNDSSVLHMGVTGKAWVGFVATAKHADYIMHWRKNLAGVNEWAWRQQDHGLGGMWDLVDNIPDGQEEKKCDVVETAVLKTWLPDPETIGPWCKEKSDDYFRGI